MACVHQSLLLLMFSFRIVKDVHYNYWDDFCFGPILLVSLWATGSLAISSVMF